MNINSPEESLEAWNEQRQSILSDPAMPVSEKLRMLHETDEECAQMYDAVSTYFNARFMQIV